jgi:RecF/RecN/SMC N terminal domain
VVLAHTIHVAFCFCMDALHVLILWGWAIGASFNVCWGSREQESWVGKCDVSINAQPEWNRTCTIELRHRLLQALSSLQRRAGAWMMGKESSNKGRFYISRLRVKSFKSFGKSYVQFTFHSRYLVAVVGPNGCGKSNLLEAIAFAIGLPTEGMRVKSFKDLRNNDNSSEVTRLLKCLFALPYSRSWAL